MCFLLQAGKKDALWVGKYPVPSKAEGKAAITAHRISVLFLSVLIFGAYRLYDYMLCVALLAAKPFVIGLMF